MKELVLIKKQFAFRRMMSYQMAIWREYHRAAKYAKYVMNREDVDRTSSFFRKLAKEWKSNLLGIFFCCCVSVM